MNSMNSKVSNNLKQTTTQGGHKMKSMSKGVTSKNKKEKQTYRTTDSDKQWEVVKHNESIATPKT